MTRGPTARRAPVCRSAEFQTRPSHLFALAPGGPRGRPAPASPCQTNVAVGAPGAAPPARLPPWPPMRSSPKASSNRGSHEHPRGSRPDGEAPAGGAGLDQSLAEDLVTQHEALAADVNLARPLPSLRSAPCAEGDGETGDLAALLPAEAATGPPPRAHRLHGGDRRRCRLPGRLHRPGRGDAPFADEYPGPGDELLARGLLAPAERAGPWLDALAVVLAPAAAASGCLDDLVDALMAEPEGGRKLSHGGSPELEASHRSVEVGTRKLGGVLGVDEPLLGVPSIPQEVFIEHPSSVHRRRTVSTGAPRVRRRVRPG